MKKINWGRLSVIIFSLFLVLISFACYASFWDTIKSMVKKEAKDNNPTTSPSFLKNSLSNEEISKGLKEALKIGVKNAVNMASRPGGFLNNPKIRIPLPPELDKIGSLLKKFGYGDKVDAFETSMNRAAELAAQKALPIFADTIKGLTFDDVKKIWKGGDNAVTKYFENKTRKSLYHTFKPIVHDSMQQVDITKRFQDMISNPMVQKGGLLLGKNLDVDDYVTNGALNGLFTLLATEEKKIREDPKARTTELLKKVFGAIR